MAFDSVAQTMVHCSDLKVGFVHFQGSLNNNNGVVGKCYHKCYQFNTVFDVGLSLVLDTQLSRYRYILFTTYE